MDESSGSVSIDIDSTPFGGKEFVVKTSRGSISVFVNGDREKPALITYPDVALNCMTCLRDLMFCPEAACLLIQNFCFYHIDAPGHELGADAISSDVPLLSVDDLTDQVAEVLDFFPLKKVLCLGVTAGAYILTLFSIKYKKRALGLILVSSVCKAPSWTEWIYYKALINLLYFYGMCGVLKECLLQRYFSKDLRYGLQGAETEIIQACLRLLDERQSSNVIRFLHAINKRHDLTKGLEKLQCKTLIFVGDNSPFHTEAIHMSTKMGRQYCTVVEVQACGSLVTEEHPLSMLVPIELFLKELGFYRQPEALLTPNIGSNSTNRLSIHSCIAPELLSPESLELKLKPIKTRVDW